MIYNQDITLDLNTNTSYLVVGAKQGDNIGRTLTATILENGKVVDIPAQAFASYRIRKPNGKAEWKTAELYPHPTNRVKITLDSHDLDTSGRCYADIVLQLASQRESTVSFIIDVQAAPNIADEAINSDAFNYLHDMVNEAGNIIESAQAWTEGKRGTEDVIGDSYAIAAPSQLEVSLDFDKFKQTIDPPSINKVTDYIFIYMNGDWEYQYNGKIVDMQDLGFTITGTPAQNYIITVTASFADPTYHNNAKYYKEEADRLGQSWATGFVDGVRIPSTDPAYKQNASWLAQTYATGEFNGVVIPTTDPAYKKNSKYYRDVIAASTVDEVTTANPGMSAQASAEFDTIDDRFEFDFTLPSVKPHATIHVNNVSYTKPAAATVQVHDLSSEEIAEKKALPDGTPGKIYPGEEDNLQKSFDFSFDIPRGIYTGISNDVTVQAVNTLEPGTNAAVYITATEAEVEEDKPREKQFIFQFDIPRGNTGATGAYLTDIQVVQNSLGEAKLQYKLSSDNFIWLTTIHDKTYKDLWSVYKDSNNQFWIIDAIEENRIKIINTNNYNNFSSTGTLTWVSGGINHSNIIYTASEQFIGDWRETNGIIPVINGKDGQPGIGVAGRGIQGVSINSNYQLVITYTDGDSETITTPIRGPQGNSGIGSSGTAGRGIAGVSINSNYQLVITYTDNTSEVIPTSIRGPQGEDGNDGNDGNDGQNATVIRIGNISEAAAGSGPDVIATTDPNTRITTLDFVLPTSAPGVTIDDTTTSNATVWSSNKVNTEITSINSNISSLNTDVSTLKTDVKNANTGLLSRTSMLETKTSALETNSTSHGISIANINSKIGNTTITGTLTSNISDIHNQLDNVTNGVVKRLDNHDNEITVLQTQMATKQQALSFSYNPNDEGDLIIALVT